jgi:uncharacterized protein (TIGR02246 family)
MNGNWVNLVPRSSSVGARLVASASVLGLLGLPMVATGCGSSGGTAAEASQDGSASRAPATASQRSAINAAHQKFTAAFHAQDAAAVAALYTPQAMLLPPNADILQGRDAIRTFWQAVMTSGVRDVKLETVVLEHFGNSLAEVGKYTLYGDGGKVLDQGKYLVVWENEGGQWQLRRDIFNTSQPAS